jgi:NTE family protein
MLSIFKKHKTGLVLSGGGARGIAHLGVLQYLHENKLRPSIISGVSAGSLAAAFYADGHAPSEILDFFSSKKLYHLMRLTFPKSGFLKVKGLKDILSKNLKAQNIEDLELPIVIAATNFNTGKIEYFTRGNLIDALLASSAIPTLFELHKMNGNLYFDGGIMDNLPIKPILGVCRKYIAVHVNPLAPIEKASSPIQVAERAFHLAIAAELENKKVLFDTFIEPPELSDFSMLDVKKSREIFDIGYHHASKVLAK